MRAGLCTGTPALGEDDVAVYCDVHSSPTAANSEMQHRLGTARKTLADLQTAGPPLSIPVITAAG